MSWPTVNKYRNIKTVVDGIRFSSKKEAKRYGELKMLVKAGLISNLRLQVKHELIVNGQKIGAYVSDFEYRDLINGRSICEDVKGMRTPIYIQKKKLMKACHGIEIKEV